jgi:hypothetical protein
MLSYSIATTATGISTAIMNMACLMSTTTREGFTENTSNVVTASAQQQQQAIPIRGGAKNK